MNDAAAVAWIPVFMGIMIAVILTTGLITDSIRSNRVKRNDNHIFKAVQEARRDFR